MTDLLIQVVSVTGDVMIIGAYLALQRGWWKSHTRPYLWMYLIGASLLAAVAVWDRSLGFILLEVTWALVSLSSLLRSAPQTVR